MNTKNFKFVAVLAGIAAMCGFTARAQVLLAQPYSRITAYSTNAGTLAYAVVGNYVQTNGTAACVTYINATSDKAASKVQFYRVDAQTPATFTNSTVTLQVVQTNGIADNGLIVIRHMGNDWYELRTLTTSTGSTNLVTTVAPLQAVAPGDLIYHCVAAGYIPCGNTTITPAGSALYCGQPGLPLLMQLDATTTANLNTVTAEFR